MQFYTNNQFPLIRQVKFFELFRKHFRLAFQLTSLIRRVFMKKVGIIIFVVALAIGLVVSNMFSFGRATSKFFNFSMNFGGVHGSGNVASDKRDLTGFRAVDVGGVFQVEITAQKEFSVEVEGDDNLLPLIKTEVDDGVLKIQTDGKLSPKAQSASAFRHRTSTVSMFQVWRT